VVWLYRKVYNPLAYLMVFGIPQYLYPEVHMYLSVDLPDPVDRMAVVQREDYSHLFERLF
jgi:hypothetical protein